MLNIKTIKSYLSLLILISIIHASFGMTPPSLVEQAVKTIIAQPDALEKIKRDLEQNKLNAEIQEALKVALVNAVYGMSRPSIALKGQYNGQDIIFSAAAFRNDGSHVITTGNRNSKVAHIWDLSKIQNSGRQLSPLIWHLTKVQNSERQLTPPIVTLSGHTAWVTSVAFSPDGNYALTGSADETARLWNMQGETVKVFQGHSDIVTSVAFSPDGNYALTGSDDGTVRLWNLSTGDTAKIFTNEIPIGILSLAFSPDGLHILAGDLRGRILLWDFDKTTDPLVIAIHKSKVNSIAFNTDGSLMVTGSDDGTVEVRKFPTLEGVTGYTIAEKVTTVAFNPDGNYILVSSHHNPAYVIDITTGKTVMILGTAIDIGDLILYGAYPAVFSPDGTLVLTGGARPALWNLYPPYRLVSLGQLIDTIEEALRSGQKASGSAGVSSSQ